MRRLGVLSLGLLRQGWLRAALAGQGWRMVPGWQDCEAVAVWGRGGVAWRGQALARRRGLPLLTLEDAFLRSVLPGQGPPAGLILDDLGVHYDPAGSRVATLLQAGPEPDGATRAALALIRHHRLSKYNDWPASPDALPPRFTMVVDQVAGDAALMGAGRAEFAAMLDAARGQGHPVMIRPHPAGPGLLPRDPLPDGVALLPEGFNPWLVWERVEAVHVHSSQLGLEAILAGHRPVVHGQPIYAGWGLSEDRAPIAARTRRLDAEALFAGLYRDASLWFDPATGAAEPLSRAVARLGSAASAHARTRGRARLTAVSGWKRARVARFLGSSGPDLSVSWGLDPEADARIEDGFVRSRGLGAALVPPVSLAFDRTGLHFDPTRPSDLERFIAASTGLPPAALARAAALRARLVALNISKYNLAPDPLPPLPEGRVVLVAGQVPGDASVLTGGAGLGDAALIAAARVAEPGATILYRPHPDIVARLREGEIAEGADLTVTGGDMAALIARCDALWTDTSLAGFEALLRGRAVTCLGWPFYAGWGLTADPHDAPPGLRARRAARPTLDGLVHAALIDYPLYLDPRTGGRCGPEDILDWLEAGGVEPAVPLAGPGRWLSRLLRAARRT